MLLAMGSSAMGACADASSDPRPTLIRDVQPILDTHCALPACHGGTLVQAELSLGPGDAETALVGVPSTQVSGATRVVPGNPEESLLVQVLRAQVTDGGATTLVERMPRDTLPLASDELAVIERWIATGAAIE